jgi:hypothetical protein
MKWYRILAIFKAKAMGPCIQFLFHIFVNDIIVMIYFETDDT